MISTERSLRRIALCGAAAVAALCGFAATYDVTPSDDPATDTAAINNAIANAASGATITLGPGTYRINATISLTNGVTLLGTGWKTCILDAETRKFQFVIINHANAILKGMTVANGRPANHFYGMGVTFGSAGGRMERCRVTGCTNNGYGSYGAVCAKSGSAEIFNSRARVSSATLACSR